MLWGDKFSHVLSCKTLGFASPSFPLGMFTLERKREQLKRESEF